MQVYPCLNNQSSIKTSRSSFISIFRGHTALNIRQSLHYGWLELVPIILHFVKVGKYIM